MEFFKGITGLWKSRKAMFVVPSTFVVFVLASYGLITWDQAVSLLQVWIPAWLGAHAWEQGKLAQARTTVERLKETTFVGVPEIQAKDDGK